MNRFDVFSQLHYSDTPLLIGNVWDVTSAQLMEESGIKAIATSSGAVANSMGYNDGQYLPFGLLLETVQRIQKHISIPLSVDMERGYSTTIPGVLENIDKLLDAGVAGVNIEDSTGGSEQRSVESFQKFLSSISNHLAKRGDQLFINARTDAYLLKRPDALQETMLRAKAYEAAGANGIFVPFVVDTSAIEKIVKATALPVNVFFCKGLPDFKTLSGAGVKRISMGMALYRKMKADLLHHLKEVQQSQSVDSLFG